MVNSLFSAAMEEEMAFDFESGLAGQAQGGQQPGQQVWRAAFCDADVLLSMFLSFSAHCRCVLAQITAVTCLARESA